MKKESGSENNTNRGKASLTIGAVSVGRVAGPTGIPATFLFALLTARPILVEGTHWKKMRGSK